MQLGQALGRLLLAACTTSIAISPVQSADLPGLVAVLDPADAPQVLKQCSRSAPEGGAPHWAPQADQVNDLEHALVVVLEQRRGDYVDYIDGEHAKMAENTRTAFDFPQSPDHWKRQYVGYTIAGRQMIYGNFDPSPMGIWILCDGGPKHFGVEFDVALRKITRVEFSGGLGGPFLQPIVP